MKNKAFILDFNLLEEHDISAEEFLLLIQINNNCLNDNIQMSDIYPLGDKGFVKHSEGHIILREKGKLLLELTEIDSINLLKDKSKIKKSSRAINLELDDFIKEFRNLWKGLKPGSMGSEDSCRDKMFEWMSKNSLYSKEDIIKSAKLYLKTLDDLTYLQLAD